MEAFPAIVCVITFSISRILLVQHGLCTPHLCVLPFLSRNLFEFTLYKMGCAELAIINRRVFVADAYMSQSRNVIAAKVSCFTVTTASELFMFMFMMNDCFSTLVS